MTGGTQFEGQAYVLSPVGLADSAPAGSYAFRNRFDITSNSRFNVSDGTYILSDAQEYVCLTSTLGSKTIKNCTSLALWGSAYADFDTALIAGRKWRQIATWIFAQLAIACDFGDDDEENLNPLDNVPLHIRYSVGISDDDRAYRDRVGLLVFPVHPREPRFVYFAYEAVGLSGLGDLPNLITKAQHQHSTPWPEQLRLAWDLVHAGLGDPNPEAKYILTVTAVEALIPYREEHAHLSGLLDALKPIADGLAQFDEDTKEEVKKLLQYNKMNSVRRYGLQLADRLPGTYDGLAPKKYFDKAYGTRSDLAHGNLRNKANLTKSALIHQYDELRRFVIDILDSWAANPNFASPPKAAGK